MSIDHRVALIGAGGHSLVVIEAWMSAGRPLDALALFDQNPEKTGTERLGLIVGALEQGRVPAAQFHIAIGDNAARLRIGEHLHASGSEPCNIVHPGSQVASSAAVAPGCFVGAQAVIGPEVRLGPFTIVNHAAVVDHECHIGAGCHIAPAAVLGGAVRLGRGILVGANATILPGVTIGDDAIIGAGAVVLRDVPAGTTYVGNPGREVRTK